MQKEPEPSAANNHDNEPVARNASQLRRWRPACAESGSQRPEQPPGALRGKIDASEAEESMGRPNDAQIVGASRERAVSAEQRDPCVRQTAAAMPTAPVITNATAPPAGDAKRRRAGRPDIGAHHRHQQRAEAEL
jgi:hypothetical protein